MPTVPLSAHQIKNLQAQYEKRKAEGKDDEAMSAELQIALPAIIVFNQIDCDHDGTLSRREIHRLLECLPKPREPEGGWPNGETPKHIPLDQIMQILDSDNDGVVSLEEFVTNLQNLPELNLCINQNLDPHSGKITTYKSLELRLHETLEEAAPFEAKAAENGGVLSEEDQATLNNLRAKIASFQSTVGTAGITVFRQIDLDKSGKIDRKELLALLQTLNDRRKTEGVENAEALSIDGVIKGLDADGDELIDEDEWIMQLDRLPDLKAFISSFIDANTGKIVGYGESA